MAGWIAGAISDYVSGYVQGAVQKAGGFAGGAVCVVGEGINGVGRGIEGSIRRYGDGTKDYGNAIKDWTKADGVRAGTASNPLGLSDTTGGGKRAVYGGFKPTAALPAPAKKSLPVNNTKVPSSKALPAPNPKANSTVVRSAVKPTTTSNPARPNSVKNSVPKALPSGPTKKYGGTNLPKTNLPKTNLPKTNLPKTNLPKTNSTIGEEAIASYDSTINGTIESQGGDLEKHTTLITDITSSNNVSSVINLDYVPISTSQDPPSLLTDPPLQLADHFLSHVASNKESYVNMFNSHPKLVETERSNLIDELDCLDQCLNESRACPKEHKKQATNQGGLGQDTLSATVRHEWPDFVSLCGVAQTPHSNHFKIPSPFSSLDPIDIGHTYQRQIMDPESKVGNSEENLKFAKAELVSLKEDKTRMMKKYEIDMIIKRLEVIRNRLMTSGCSIDGSRATLTEKSKALEVELIDMKQLNAGHICQCRYGENSSTAPKPERMTVAFKLDNDGNIATDVHEFEDTSLEMSGEPTEESRENFPEVSKKVWSEESKYTKDSMNADHIHDLITGFVDNSDDRSAYPKNSNSNDRLSDNRASNNTDSEPGDFKSPYVAELERRLKDAEQKNAILKQLNTNINISSQKQSLKIAMLNKEIYTLEEYKSRNLNNLILTSCDAYHIRESSNPMKLCLKHAIQHITFLGKEKVMYKERCEERLKTIKQLRKVNTESRFWFDSELSYLKDQVKAIMLEKENAIKTCEEQKLMIEFLKEQPWRTGLKPRHQST